ncbi:MAG: MauE/DoxX family redox-associated membrane protein [Dermatophilaceae bacterium]
MSQPVRISKDVQGLAALFATSGVLHLVRPQIFESIVPRQLPERRGLVYASGVAEIVCAAGLLHPRTRKAAGWASALLLVAIFPANIQMAVSEGKRARRGTGSRGKQVATLVRLPLQIPLIRTALKAAGRA